MAGMAYDLCVRGGMIYDPAHGVDGAAQDIWIAAGKIVATPTDPQQRAARTIDAAGLVVMPGGVDMHCHIAGPKVNVGRLMRPEEKRTSVEPRFSAKQSFRSGTLGSTPSTFTTGYRYAGLGYTTAFDAAVAPLAARHAHQEFADTPCIDKGMYLLVGNNHYLMQQLGRGDAAQAEAFLAWLLGAARGYAPKLVDPGGVEQWKQGRQGNSSDLDEIVPGFAVTPRKILTGIATAANSLKLPHPLHVHCNNLGLPGNWQTTLETMRALSGHRAHLTHIQFHSYGGGNADEGTFGSRVAPLVEYFNDHAELSVDVGQVMFGSTTSMTGDSPVGYYLSQLYGTRWFSNDIECEAGCGIAPIEYKNKSLVNAWQWAIGLEWFLLAKDPWRIALSTDHPNGGSFLAYPRIIRLLMDKAYRDSVLAEVHPKVRAGSALAQLDREYTLGEICTITRAAPAKLLGLKDKGHLGLGADADITVYLPDADREQMFSLPKYVLRGGELLIDGGEPRHTSHGRTLHVSPEYDREREATIATWFDEHYSLRMKNYPISDQWLAMQSAQ